MARLYGPGPEAPPPLLPSADLRGLSTMDVDARPVGELYGTLAEQESGLIRYLDVALTRPARHVLVPIGHARIDREHVPPRVRLRAATFEDLLSVPEFSPGETDLEREYQDSVMQAHGRLFYGSRYYAHPSYDHSGPYAGAHPLEPTEDDAEAAEEAESKPRLIPLAELRGFRIARGVPDIRGQPLTDEDETVVGEVSELLVEPGARRVRYVVVSLEGLNRAAALPVGYLEISEEGGRVSTPALDAADIRVLPPYEPPLTREDENRILAALEGRLSGERYFSRPDFRPVS